MIGDVAHICNRGIKKHNIFLDDKDRLRFVLNLYRLNNKNGYLRITNHKDPFNNLPEQDKLVEILKWTLLPNHYHLLLYEKTEGGIVEFVKRIGNAYTKYSNIKHSSSGYIFQNSAKIIFLRKDPHYLYIPFYIDMNSLDLFPNGKLNMTSPEKLIAFLREYRWSSYRDYFGVDSNFLPIINKEVFYESFDKDPESYQAEIFDLIEARDFDEIKQHVNLAG